ncbi:restriction endonuclease subunit S [Fusicatenibacter saccharivorans]|uniref:restriction endonuclease subunit S n=1 Tax=Fusicatenibacter saccharivorans TaxID=1150298 RepID=UPI002ED39F21
MRANVWEQRKLSDIYGSIGNAFVGTATPYYAEQGHFYLESNNVKDGQINHNSEIFINDEFYEKQKDKLLHTGDMVMVQSGHVGHAAVIPEELNNTAAHALIMFRNPKEEIEPYFLNYEYQTDKAKKKIENITTGNTIKHILASDMQEFVVDVPKYEEQKVIADYFRNIDHLITLHQCKYDTDKNRESFAWEQRKFADFTWDAGKRNREDLDLEPYAITNEHGFIRQCDAHDDFGYMKDTDRKAYNIVQPNSFAYNPARINVGSIGYYKGVENVIVSSLYEVFQTDNYVNDRFLWHWFKSDEFPRWIERLQEGSVRLYFYYDKLCECRLYMPSLEEQEKIASFLDALDRLITLHHRKHFYLKIATKTLKITIQLTKGGRKNVRIGVNDREKTD